MPKQKAETQISEFAREFSKRLRQALGAMPKTELARLIEESGIELKPGRLGHYFTGRNYPDPPVLATLCKTMGISADWVLGLAKTEEPVAELEEKLAAATGEDKINKVMRGMSKAKQKQVLDFAEYLLTQETTTDKIQSQSSRLPANEAQRNLAMIRSRLDSVEEKWGIDGRRDMEKQIRRELDGSGLSE